MDKCKNWKPYKGLRKPTCNNNKPCSYCCGLYVLTAQCKLREAEMGRAGSVYKKARGEYSWSYEQLDEFVKKHK